MANYIYIRVSSKDQNIARQMEDVNNIDIPEENIFIDKITGATFDRPAYQKMINTIKEGDVIYFHSLDRMGRSYDDILAQWQYITKTIRADIIILDMPLLNTTIGNNDLTGKFIADMVLQILSYVAQTERENIKRRAAEGVRIAKEQGKYIKKDIDMDLFRQLKADVDRGLLTVTTAAQELGITRKTWYIKCKELG